VACHAVACDIDTFRLQRFVAATAGFEFQFAIALNCARSVDSDFREDILATNNLTVGCRYGHNRKELHQNDYEQSTDHVFLPEANESNSSGPRQYLLKFRQHCLPAVFRSVEGLKEPRFESLLATLGF
jgi:hypothetical protein